MHLVARSLSFDRGPDTILAGANLSVTTGQRVGIVGPNGAGKTTLLRLLAGDLVASSGSVERHPVDLFVGHLHQEVAPDGAETASTYLARRTGVAAAQQEFDTATTAIARGEDRAAERYDAAMSRWLATGAPDFDHRVESVFDRIGVPPARRSQPVATMSGGERSRVDLAAVLLHRADLLLLDEPTNDLDLAGLAVLEAQLLRGETAVVVVSHDRAFLERTVTDVVEIDEHTRRTITYTGGWRAYETERAAARRRAEQEYARYTEERGQLAARAQREHEWSDRGVGRARRSGEPDKNIRKGRIARAEARAGRARRVEDQLARLEVVEQPWRGWDLRLELAQADRSGVVVAELVDATVRRARFELGPVTVSLRFGERVGLVGANGSGKTTLIDALLGRLDVVAGEQRLGPSVVVGELSQDRADFGSGTALLATFVTATGADEEAARSVLAKFGLSAEHVRRPARDLSPGERTRAVLASFQVRGANLLVLDEPTNHLDLPAIEQLETALGSYGGTMIVVSHDRRFLENLALSRTWTVTGGTVVES